MGYLKRLTVLVQQVFVRLRVPFRAPHQLQTKVPLGLARPSARLHHHIQHALSSQGSILIKSGAKGRLAWTRVFLQSYRHRLPVRKQILAGEGGSLLGPQGRIAASHKLYKVNGSDEKTDKSILLQSSELSAEAESKVLVRNPITIATSIDNFRLTHLIGVGCNAAVFSAQLADSSEQPQPEQNSMTPEDYNSGQVSEGLVRVEESATVSIPLSTDSVPPDDQEEEIKERSGGNTVAVKVMYNYADRSDAESIQREMKMEMLPAHKESLGAHPNIVEMGEPFIASLPPRLLPSATSVIPCVCELGRSTTCVLPMRQYSHTLREYLGLRGAALDLNGQLDLFRQLVEGVAWLERNGVAHRDLKSNNILISERDNDSPRLVIADFGNATDTLLVPYTSGYMSKGGNSLYMAPEISSARPGHSVVLDYSKADSWAVGALAYEIFESPDLFTRPVGVPDEDSWLRSFSPVGIPALMGEMKWVMNVVRCFLQVNPEERLTCTDGATLFHIQRLCSKEEILHPFALSVRPALSQLCMGMFAHVYVCTRRLERELWSMFDWSSLLLLQRESTESLRMGAYRLGVLHSIS